MSFNGSLNIYKRGRYVSEIGKEVLIESGPEGFKVTFSDNWKELRMNNDDIHNNFNKAIELAEKKLGKLTVMNVKTEALPLEITIDKNHGFRIRNNKIIAVLTDGIWVEDCYVDLDNKTMINFDSRLKHFFMK